MGKTVKTSGIVRNNEGVVLIEMAIALPVLLLIVLGGIELGLYFFKQHIVARAIDSVVIPLQLNPEDPRREIETMVRNSGMGMIDFSLGNRSGNYICARAYSDFANAQKNLCSVNTSTGQNGWYPEAKHWLLNPTKPYYVAIVAHVEYKSLVGIKGMLPPINEWHVFQVSPIALPVAATPALTPATPSSAPTPPQNPPLPNLGGGKGQNEERDIKAATQQLQRILSTLPALKQ